LAKEAEAEDDVVVKRPVIVVSFTLVAACFVTILLAATGQARFYWIHLRSDDPLDQITVSHFNYADYARGIPPKPMAGSDVYFGHFGGNDVGHSYDLVVLPPECASEKYILHFDQVLKPEGQIWAAGPFAVWWQPSRLRPIHYIKEEDKPAVILDVTYSAQFRSPSCGPIWVHY